MLSDTADLTGFDIDVYLDILNCSQGNIPPLISQPLAVENNPTYEHLSYSHWERSDVVSMKTEFIDSKMPFFEARFFRWFVSHMMKPLLNASLA
jgi:hypothetical protein